MVIRPLHLFYVMPTQTIHYQLSLVLSRLKSLTYKRLLGTRKYTVSCYVLVIVRAVIDLRPVGHRLIKSYTVEAK